MNTPLPLDAAALDWLHDNHAHDLLGNHPQVIYQARAALTLAARVAELEDHANALRDALAGLRGACEFPTDCAKWALQRCRQCEVNAVVEAALAAHPAASLAAHDAEVVKRGCAAIREVRIEHTPALEDDDQGPFLHESDVANLTRAIVERAHKTHPSGGADCMAQEVK